MTPHKLNMRICMRKKRITLNRVAIGLMGNPTHLSLHYDEREGMLYFSPAAPDDLDAYEIPRFYWSDNHAACEIARIALLKALQYRLEWEDGSKHYYEGRIAKLEDIPTAVFDLTSGVRVR